MLSTRRAGDAPSPHRFVTAAFRRGPRSGYRDGVSTFPVCEDELDPSVDLYQLPDVAKLLSVPVTRTHQMLRDHDILAVRRDGVVGVPSVFFDVDYEPGRSRILKSVSGTIAVLRDGGYDDQEILRWLFTEDPSLPGRPAEVLQGDQAREVVRRAQAMAF